MEDTSPMFGDGTPTTIRREVHDKDCISSIHKQKTMLSIGEAILTMAKKSKATKNSILMEEPSSPVPPPSPPQKKEKKTESIILGVSNDDDDEKEYNEKKEILLDSNDTCPSLNAGRENEKEKEQKHQQEQTFESFPVQNDP